MAVGDVINVLMQGNNLALFIVLILLFVVSYKLMQAVMQTFIMVAMSGAFFLVLSYLGLGPEFSIGRMVFFMIAGLALYLGFSTVGTLTTIATYLYRGLRAVLGGIHSLLDLLIPDNILGKLRRIGSGIGGLTDRFGDDTDHPTGTRPKQGPGGGEGGDSGSSEKMVILEEMDDD